MSLADLMKPMDTHVVVGVMASGDTEIPVYIVDFGNQYPPMDVLMSRYKKLTLDVLPDANGATYCVTSDKIVCEITGKLLDQLSEKSLKEVLGEAKRTATPEFASSVHVYQVDHDKFQSARQGVGGYWVLVLLSATATEMLLDANDVVVYVAHKERSG